MKKIILCCFVILFAYNIFAQNKSISGGLYFGPGLSWLSSDSKTVKEEGLRLNYSFGALLDINIINNFAFSTGLTFNKYNGKISYPFGASDIIAGETGTRSSLPDNIKMTYKLNYLAIPLGLKGKTNEIGYLTYFLKAGITPMINIKAKANIGDSENELINKEIRLLNLGWHIGGGLEWNLAGNTKLLVELLYTGGIFDIDKTKVYTSGLKVETHDPKININDISLKVGIIF